MTGPLVSGELVFDPSELDLARAVISIRLEDVSVADQPSETVVERVLTDLPEDAIETGRVPFELYGDPPDDEARYTVAAHVDVNGSGRVSRGDFITTEAYPVLTFGHPNRTIVRVQRVG